MPPEPRPAEPVPKEWASIVDWFADWFAYINDEIGKVKKVEDSMDIRLHRIEEHLGIRR